MPYKDEALCDVVPMSVCHVLLGRPWQYDRGAIYDCRRNLVTIEKDAQKFTLASLKEKEKKVKNLSLVKSCGADKQVAEVILDDGMDLKKGLVDETISKVE